MKSHTHYMDLALDQARHAFSLDEVPIGAVVVDPVKGVIGKGHNRRESDHDPTAHAEMLALRAAGAAKGDWRLTECALYVTVEPCPMCAGALVNARIKTLVYGVRDSKAGAVVSLMSLTNDSRLNHQVEVIEGVQNKECAELLRSFFTRLRSGRIDGPMV